MWLNLDPQLRQTIAGLVRSVKKMTLDSQDPMQAPSTLKTGKAITDRPYRSQWLGLGAQV